MVLPSQAAYSTNQRSHMYRRHRNRRAPLVVSGAVMLLIGFGAYKLWFGEASLSAARAAGESSLETRATDVPLSTDQRVAAEPRPRERAGASEPKPARPEPPRITMGESRLSGPVEQSHSPARVEATTAPAVTIPEHMQVIAPPPAAATPPTRSEPERGVPTGSRTTEQLERALALAVDGRLLEARRALTDLLKSGSLAASDAQRARDALADANDVLVFGQQVIPGDPFAYAYTIKSGDRLERIARSEDLAVDWRFVQRINRIDRPERIQLGQRLKLITGPFHAIVYKREFRLDLYLGNPESDDRVFVRSFPVGLGEYHSTPVGHFRVRPYSRLYNPQWTNPRTGETFDANDPRNPIGDRWIGLEGTDDATRDLAGYGIHGTIEPESIGQERSMGCVRMLPDDVAIIYEVLMEEVSTVEIRP